MFEEPVQSEKYIGANPLLAIGMAVGVAVLMITATTISFIRSDAYDTVKQIKTGSKMVQLINRDGLDILSPIKAADIDIFAQDFNKQLRSLDDYEDFGPNAVSDTSLGL